MITFLNVSLKKPINIGLMIMLHLWMCDGIFEIMFY